MTFSWKNIFFVNSAIVIFTSLRTTECNTCNVTLIKGPISLFVNKAACVLLASKPLLSGRYRVGETGAQLIRNLLFQYITDPLRANGTF